MKYEAEVDIFIILYMLWAYIFQYNNYNVNIVYGSNVKCITVIKSVFIFNKSASFYDCHFCASVHSW